MLFSLPAAWTDVVGEDPFVVVASGRCPFGIDGLLGLAALLDRWCSEPVSCDVERIMP